MALNRKRVMKYIQCQREILYIYIYSTSSVKLNETKHKRKKINSIHISIYEI